MSDRKKNVPAVSDWNIKGVAFDIDGTLYAQWKLYVRMAAHFLRHCIFYLHYGIVRKQMRALPAPATDHATGDFYKAQAEMMASRTKLSVAQTHDKITDVIYEALKPYFLKIKPYAHIEETFRVFHEAGLKVAILSDFPPEQKGDVWGCEKWCDVILSSETTGALKPSALPFTVLSEKMGLKPEEILYVGNSEKYDIAGSQKAGMKAALIVPKLKRFFYGKKSSADIIFSDFRELQKAVLG